MGIYESRSQYGPHQLKTASQLSQRMFSSIISAQDILPFENIENLLYSDCPNKVSHERLSPKCANQRPRRTMTDLRRIQSGRTRRTSSKSCRKLTFPALERVPMHSQRWLKRPARREKSLIPYSVIVRQPAKHHTIPQSFLRSPICHYPFPYSPGASTLHAFANSTTSVLASITTSSSQTRDPIHHLHQIHIVLLPLAYTIRCSGLDDYDDSGHEPHHVFHTLCLRFDEALLELAKRAWCPQTSPPGLFESVLAGLRAGSEGSGMRCHLVTRSVGFMRDAEQVARRRVWGAVVGKVLGGGRLPMELVQGVAREINRGDWVGDCDEGEEMQRFMRMGEWDLRERYKPWPTTEDEGRCRTVECREAGFCVTGGCEGTTRRYWSISRRRFLVMHGRKVCKFEECDRRQRCHGEWEDWGIMPRGWGKMCVLRVLNRQRRIVRWSTTGECYVSAEEESI